MNWYELKSKCIDQVAWKISAERLPVGHNKDPFEVRNERWTRLAKEAEPDAIEAINAMSNMALLDLISEVVGGAEA